jgi:uncharacterized protein YerC
VTETRTPQPRADVAELLAQGATYRTIRQLLGVSGHVISATRKAHNIPVPAGPGRRPTPEERTHLTQRVTELLRQGATYKAISAEVGISQPTILRIRLASGTPLTRRDPRPGRTIAETMALYAEAHGDGHVRWTGPYAGRTPKLYANGRCYNARHVAFRSHHGRNPVGYVLTDCPETGCMAGPHLTDLPMRSARDTS